MQVGIPYLKRKLDDAYEIHAGGAAANLFGTNYRPRNEPGENVSTGGYPVGTRILLIRALGNETRKDYIQA